MVHKKYDNSRVLSIVHSFYILYSEHCLLYNYIININRLDSTGITVMKEFTYKLAENDRELNDAFAVRRQAFVEEQGVSEDIVFDGCEDRAMHMVVKDGESVIGTARVRFLDDGQAKLERMAVLKPFRGVGIGKRIMSFLIEELKGKEVERVVLHAQYGVIEFYKACGFNPLDLPFEEAGIKHLKMEKKF